MKLLDVVGFVLGSILLHVLSEDVFVTQDEMFDNVDSHASDLQKEWSTHQHTNTYTRVAFGDLIRRIT